MSKKILIILSLIIVAVITFGVRVYFVNAGVATEYQIEGFQVGEEVSFDNAIFKVVNFSYGEVIEENGYKSVPAHVEMEIKNTSDENISISKIIEAKLAYGMDYYQTREGEFNVSELKNLAPKATTKLTLIYNVSPEYERKDAELYIDQSLYGDQVEEKYQQGKRYGKVIGLKH